MLLESYQKEIFRPKCNPGFKSVHCIAHLDQDIGEALPYLNAELGEVAMEAGEILPGGIRDCRPGDVYPIHHKAVELEPGK